MRRREQRICTVGSTTSSSSAKCGSSNSALLHSAPHSCSQLFSLQEGRKHVRRFPLKGVQKRWPSHSGRRRPPVPPKRPTCDGRVWLRAVPPFDAPSHGEGVPPRVGCSVCR